MFYVENPKKFDDKFKTKSSRLNNWNYSTPGFYFITIKTLNDNNFFGKIINNEMELNKSGEITKSELLKTFEIRKNMKLNEWVIMPNHVHLIIQLLNLPVETPRMASLQNNQKIALINYSHKNHPNYYLRLNRKSNQLIPKTIQQFKSAVKRQCNQNNLFFGWQTRFYDQIIKSEIELNNIRQYIKNNPVNWEK